MAAELLLKGWDLIPGGMEVGHWRNQGSFIPTEPIPRALSGQDGFPAHLEKVRLKPTGL